MFSSQANQDWYLGSYVVCLKLMDILGGGWGVLSQSQSGSSEKPSQESLAELFAYRKVSREKMVVRRDSGRPLPSLLGACG